MTEPEPYFVIPTHRLRDVGAAIRDPWLEGDKIADSVKSDTDLKSSECKVENEPSWEEASHN